MNQDYSGTTCAEKVKSNWGGSAIPICITAAEGATTNSMGLNKTTTAGYYISDDGYWSSVEVSSSAARRRHFYSYYSFFGTYDRSYTYGKALCVGD